MVVSVGVEAVVVVVVEVRYHHRTAHHATLIPQGGNGLLQAQTQTDTQTKRDTDTYQGSKKLQTQTQTQTQTDTQIQIHTHTTRHKGGIYTFSPLHPIRSCNGEMLLNILNR